MILTNAQVLITIAVVAAGTALTRSLPFFLFPSGKKPPVFIRRLQFLLPSAVIGMLVVYCLKNIDPFSGSHAIPEISALLCTVTLHIWKRNPLLSIGAGTVFYMLLVQCVF